MEGHHEGFHDILDEDSSDDNADEPPFVSYLFADYFVINVEQLQELLSGLISSDDVKDKDSLDDIVVKIIDHRDSEAFTCLLDSGYKVEVLNSKGESAVHLAYDNGFLREYCQCRDRRKNLESKIGNVNYADCHGLSLLHIACAVGLEDTVNKFLENKEEVNTPYLSESIGDVESEVESYDNGFTPLHFAVKSLRLEIVKLLLDNGANVDATDLWSRTPLHLASQTYTSHEYPTRDLEIMELLIEKKCDVNFKDAFGNGPLHAVFGDFERTEWAWSSRRGKQTKKLEVLLKHGAAAIEVNNNGDSVLHRIVKDTKPARGSECDRSFADDTHQVGLISTVLACCKSIDINVKNKRGNSPLDLAICRLSSAIVSVLLEHKADCSTVKFRDKKSYFKCRLVAPNLEQVKNLIRIIELLTENGFKVTEKDNAAILKYLVHSPSKCECWHRTLHKSNALRDNVTNLFNYGSAVHISCILKRVTESDQRKSYAYNDVILDIAAFYFKCLKHAEFFLDHLVEKGINMYMLENDYSKSEYSHWDVKLNEEIKEMKGIILKDKSSIFDLMTMPPNKIYKSINDVDIDWGTVDKLKIYQNIVKGHVARSLVRTYLEKSTFGRLKTEFFPLLFNHLCKDIFIYLNDEDILNMNLALMASDR